MKIKSKANTWLTAHALARRLLKGPDIEVFVHLDDNENAVPLRRQVTLGVADNGKRYALLASCHSDYVFVADLERKPWITLPKTNHSKLGYWHSKSEPQYPIPIENSASDKQVRLQMAALKKLTAGAQNIAYKGRSTCRVCGERNGSGEHKTKFGFFIPSGLSHYIQDHHVLVPGLLEANAVKTRSRA